MAYIKQIKSTDNVAYDLAAKTVIDTGDSSKITIAYSKSTLKDSEYSYLAAWNGRELRTVSKDYFAAAEHTHPYLPLAGGTMTGSIYFSADYTKMIGCDTAHGLHMLNAGSYVGTTD